MEAFGDALLSLLKLNDLKQDDLCRWIVDRVGERGPSTASGVKEHLRQWRKNGYDAYQYPFISEIVDFFKANGRDGRAANMLQHVFFTQCHTRGLITGFGENRTDHDSNNQASNLSWLQFPTMDFTKEVTAEWRVLAADGDYDLYFSALALYRRYSNSYLHAPVRKRIAIDLARIAITFGDYSDAYIIAKRYELAWMRMIRRHSQERRMGLKLLLNPQDIYDYLRALQVQTAAFSHMFFFAPIQSSKDLFRKARREAYIYYDHGLISEQHYFELMVQWAIRYLRAVTRAHLRGLARKRDLRFARWIVDRSKRLYATRPYLLSDVHLFADTLARVFALIPPIDIEESHQWRHLAEREREDRDRVDYALSGRRRSIHRAYRSIVTEIIVSGKALENDIAGRRMEELVRLVGPHKIRHSKLMIASLSMYLAPHSESDDICSAKSGIFGYLNDSEFANQLSPLTRQELDTLARKEQELFFEVNQVDGVVNEDFRICIEQANRNVQKVSR